MSKIAIKLYGREYLVNCDPGEEDRLNEVVKLAETRMQKAAERVGTTVTDQQLLVITCLGVIDELYEMRLNAEKNQRREYDLQRRDEEIMIAAVDHLRQRVAMIASEVGHA